MCIRDRPLPELASSLSGTVSHYEAFMEALRRSAPVPIEFEPMAENMDGYFSSDQQRIAIREGMSEVQTVSAAVHELSLIHIYACKIKSYSLSYECIKGYGLMNW